MKKREDRGVEKKKEETDRLVTDGTRFVLVVKQER